MNGTQIENVLELIDCNIELTRSEATAYLRANRHEVAESIANFGKALIPTSAGTLTLRVEDLQGAAA
jgi:hypothetical protein